MSKQNQDFDVRNIVSNFEEEICQYKPANYSDSDDINEKLIIIWKSDLLQMKNKHCLDKQRVKEILYELPRTLLWDILENEDIPHRKKFIIQQKFYKGIREKGKELGLDDGVDEK